jgi:indolepyruvate ferredoxin oxidoreductase
MRWLRGTRFDIFGYTAERRMERQFITNYIALVENKIMRQLNRNNHAEAVVLAELPQSVKGFGHVKLRNMASVDAKMRPALQRFLKSSQTSSRANPGPTQDHPRAGVTAN